jgi:hypothetical protein
MMEGADYDALREDIRARGQLEPCITWVDEDGEVLLLDGRNRALACADLGVEPSIRRVECAATDVVALVVSLNLRRRHLNPTQLAAVTVALARLEEDDAAKRQRAGVPANLQEGAGEAVEIACAMTGAKPRSVYAAKSVADSDDPRAPEMFERMLTGKMSTNAAVTALKGEKPAPSRAAVETRIMRDVAECDDVDILNEIMNCIRVRIAELEDFNDRLAS